MQPARVVNRRVVVEPARLEQQDPDAGIDEASRDDGTGRAGADDHDVRVAVAHAVETQTLLTSV